MRHISLALVILMLSFNGALAKARHKVKKPAGPPSPIAMYLFGAQKLPSSGAPRPIGSYAKGCIAGAKPLPIDGPAWEVMRLSRNRNWGHPVLINYIERLAGDAKTDGWPGLLIGDMSQPMGGPLPFGHASHQIGLDVDIWLTPMPQKRLTPEERDTIPMASVLAVDGVSLDASKWSLDQNKLIKRAASYPEVTLIFVHPAIKKTLCDWAGNDKDKAWLSKVRPWWGHDDHFHVRLACPPNSPSCVKQPILHTGDGCGKEVESWLKKVRKPAREPNAPPPPAFVKTKPGRAIRLSALPAECTKLLGAAAKPAAPAVPMEPIPLPDRKPAPAGKTAESEAGGG
ncbi:MAG: penicillin-insensitive murein endopeptidase [Rhodomicrobiaceae bacterium]